METVHRTITGDSRQLSNVGDNEIQLVVTSPPYPMIEMWDGVFSSLNSDIGVELDANEGEAAFDLMHAELRKTWEEVARVLVDGGVACINIGDATRKVDSNFRVYQNHAQIIEDFTNLGFDPLPDILWRKPVNSGTKFMGSGMIPPNAYATLEHEYLLVFRKGDTLRSFDPGSERRYSAAYFWEERNEWFSDIWEGIAGEHQALSDDRLRERSGAFPFEVPYRLINMYSIYGDTVLDPFWGTGTTSLAAMVTARNSIGYELDPEFIAVFEDRLDDLKPFAQEVIEQRISRHVEYVERNLGAGDTFQYESTHYGFPVKTSQEKNIKFYAVDGINQIEDRYEVTHEEVGEEAVTDTTLAADRSD